MTFSVRREPGLTIGLIQGDFIRALAHKFASLSRTIGAARPCSHAPVLMADF